MPTDNPNANMSMSPAAKAKMRTTERVVLRYYNDMGIDKGTVPTAPASWHIEVCAQRKN
jgi:hypothetical protein